MFAIAIDCGDQLLNGRVALGRDLLQAAPERLLKADARLMACNDNRALRNQRLLHGLSPQMSPIARPLSVIGICNRRRDIRRFAP